MNAHVGKGDWGGGEARAHSTKSMRKRERARANAKESVSARAKSWKEGKQSGRQRKGGGGKVGNTVIETGA